MTGRRGEFAAPVSLSTSNAQRVYMNENTRSISTRRCHSHSIILQRSQSLSRTCLYEQWRTPSGAGVASCILTPFTVYNYLNGWMTDLLIRGRSTSIRTYFTVQFENGMATNGEVISTSVSALLCQSKLDTIRWGAVAYASASFHLICLVETLTFDIWPFHHTMPKIAKQPITYPIQFKLSWLKCSMVKMAPKILLTISGLVYWPSDVNKSNGPYKCTKVAK